MDFWSSRYLPLNQGLLALRGVLSLDLYLGRHIDALIREISKKAMCQYVFAYSTVKLDSMAAAFGMDVSAMESHVSKLVMSGDIQVRLDSQNQVLVAQNDDKRGSTFNQALETGRSFLNEAQSMMLRLDMLEKGVVYEGVKQRNRKKRHAAPTSAQQQSAAGGEPEPDEVVCLIAHDHAVNTLTTGR